MDIFTSEEQQWLIQRFLNRSKRTGQTISEIQTSFVTWFTKVKQVDVLTLKYDHNQQQNYNVRYSTNPIQQVADELLNTQEAKDNLKLLAQGFFHCWIKTGQLPFLELTQNGYCECVDTEWRYVEIEIKEEDYRCIFVVEHKLLDYLTNEEFEYLCQQLNPEQITKFTKWFIAVKSIDARFLKEEEIQPLIDKFFNDQEGEQFLHLILNKKFKYMDNNYSDHILNYFNDSDVFGGHRNVEKTWWIKFNVATRQYVMVKK